MTETESCRPPTPPADQAEPEHWRTISALLSEDPPVPDALRQFLCSLSPADTALAVSRLSHAERGKLPTALGPEQAAVLLRDITPEQGTEILEKIGPEEAAPIVDELPAGEQADILRDLKSRSSEAILKEMPRADAEKARELLQYPSNTAGGIMIAEYLAYDESLTVREVLDDLRVHRARYGDYEVQYAYITGQDGALTGVLRMRDLLICGLDLPIRDIMIGTPFHVPAPTPLDQLIRIFEEHKFLGIPVTDDSGHLIGVLRKSSVLSAAEKEVNSVFLKAAGIIGGDELRSMPLYLRSLRRLAWLVPNIFLNVIAASVIALYQDTIQAVIALAVFLPIVSDMSGCSGNQAVAVSMRELTLGLVKPTEAFRVFFKEATLGLINGTVLGALLGFAAWLWKGNLAFGLVIGGALAINTLVSVVLGGLVPLALRKLKVDPALASSPILTTATDMCGFFLVLNLAALALEKLPAS